ncbi:MAG: hypothetical protein JWM88_1435 [Verrucomicrobia bacterium]|nr:hypothetical protein [Verrucomicrobiota bacterium]
MNSTSLALFLLGATASVVGTLALLKNFHGAVEGYEDSQGFHYGRPSKELVVRTAVARARSYEHQTAA